jgi:hypothetical protein
MMARVFRFIGLGFAIGIVAFLVWFSLRWNALNRAVVRWERVGGGVNVNYDEMFLGSMPGVPTSRNHAEICAAAQQLNRSGRVKRMHLAGLDWECDQLKELLAALDLNSLGLDRIPLSDDCVEFLANRPKLIEIGIGGNLVSVEAIERLLESSPERIVVLSGIKISDEERRTLSTKYGARLIFY